MKDDDGGVLHPREHKHIQMMVDIYNNNKKPSSDGIGVGVGVQDLW